jgi:hypothetical protein
MIPPFVGKYKPACGWMHGGQSCRAFSAWREG